MLRSNKGPRCNSLLVGMTVHRSQGGVSEALSRDLLVLEQWLRMESEFARAKLRGLSFIKSAYAGAPADSVSSDVPWPAIFRLASAESCLGTLCDCVLSAEVPEFSDVAPLLTLFRDRERERNTRIAGVLDETLTRLSSRGVEAIALKGAAFLACEAACSRSMLDIDLLIRPGDKDIAFEVLTRDGYKVPDDDKWYETLKHHHAPPILDPSGAIAIELHTRLAPNFDNPSISPDVIFRTAQFGGFVGNSPVAVPSDTHRLLHLIVHSMLADNGFWMFKIRLRDLIDLLELQKAGRVDWKVLQTAFMQIGYESRAAGFLLAAELLLFPAFQAPEWAASSRRWAERAVRGFFEPNVSRGRRAVGQFLADIEAILQNPRRLRVILLPDRLKNFVTSRCLPIIERKNNTRG